jgi:hypothetical protein
MEHATWKFECVRALVTTMFTIWCTASLAALCESLVTGPQMSFLRRCSKVLPILWWPAAVRSDVVHWHGVASLIFIRAGSWSFI